ncbi:MAG TPA: homoserine dehydrogenase [Phycisphaerae bacterium]|nr:homoserine dehydrogenase [Phycisphaerae bacterium]
MASVGVAVVGFGTVGTGVVRLLMKDAARIEQAAGCQLALRHVCDADLKRPRSVQAPKDLLTDDLERVLADDQTQIVVETVGGTTVAVDIMKRALAAGKDVVTANKAALAERGAELFEAARRARRSISFEASCAAGIPVIRAIRDGLVANRITALLGILNGTCNYILTEMSATGEGYGRALADAQAKGYAEADPRLDVSGEDARHKLAILAGLAFGAEVRVGDVYVEGIADLDPSDIRYGKQLGYTLKLLAIGRDVDGALSLRVHPTFVPDGSPLATVGGADNAVLVTGHAVGDTFYVGPGAGQMPTASSIVADIVDAALGRARITFEHVALLAGRGRAVPVQPIQDVWTRYYLRFDVVDEPGILASIAGVLGRHKISIASVLQHESASPESVPLVITTHLAREGSVSAALEEIRRLAVVVGRSVRIRMLEGTETPPAGPRRRKAAK